VANTGDLINNWLLVIGLLTTLTFFFFSKEHKGALGGTAKVGINFLMVSFGASYGYTVMARISLLIGRVMFLLRDWLGIMQF
jgi:LPXTG-motif cell wall-anchored protein